MPEEISISIDGPTASGKTTLAVRVASRLRTTFLDTGLTFRGIAYLTGKLGIEPEDDWKKHLQHLPARNELEDKAPSEYGRIYFQGSDVSEQIFDQDLDAPLKNIARNPRWRTEVLAYHRRLISGLDSCVVVGRDVATTLLPNATLKVALTASLPVRRERRRAQYRDLPKRSTAVSEETELDMEIRNSIGRSDRSLVLDTTYLPPGAVCSAVWNQLDGIG